jgi:hypothetical protein
VLALVAAVLLVAVLRQGAFDTRREGVVGARGHRRCRVRASSPVPIAAAKYFASRLGCRARIITIQDLARRLCGCRPFRL